MKSVITCKANEGMSILVNINKPTKSPKHLKIKIQITLGAMKTFTKNHMVRIAQFCLVNFNERYCNERENMPVSHSENIMIESFTLY